MKLSRIVFFFGIFITVVSVVAIPFVLGMSEQILGFGIERVIERDPLLGYGAIAGMVSIPIFGAFLIIASTVAPLIANKRKRIRASNYGSPAVARIVALVDTGTRINEKPLVRIRLEVHPPGQQPFTAEVSQTLSIVDIPAYQPGKVFDVKYIPGTTDVAIIGPRMA